jgi:hypothetical protein
MPDRATWEEVVSDPAVAAVLTVEVTPPPPSAEKNAAGSKSTKTLNQR